MLLTGCLEATPDSSKLLTRDDSIGSESGCLSEETITPGSIGSVSTMDGTSNFLVRDVPRPWRVAADADWVYYTEIAAGECNASVKRVSRNDLTLVEVLIGGLQDPGPLLLTGNRLYVADIVHNGSIYEVDLISSPPTVTELVTGRENPFDIVVDANGDLYYTTDLGVERFSPGGGEPVVIVSLGFALGLAMDDTFVYVFEREFGVNGQLFRINKLDPASPILLIEGLTNPYLPVLDGTTLYFAEFSPEFAGATSPNGKIRKVQNVKTCTFCSAITLVSSLNGPRRVAVDASHVYFSEVWAGAIKKVDKVTGGTPITLATGRTQPMDLAVHDTMLFFAELGPDVTCCF